jgi:TIR domain
MLSVSERISYITEIARALAQEKWDLIDLTLGQFGFQTTPNWEGDMESYIVWSIKEGDSDKLVELAKHLGFEPGDRRPVVDPGFWKLGYFRLFISHISAHKSHAVELQTHLLDLGISAFVAHQDIEPTAEWQDQIELALNTCDGMLAILTPDFHASLWTDQEVGFAMGRGVLILSLRLGQDPYGFIGKFQGIANKPERRLDAREIFLVLLKNKQTAPRMREALVAAFENAPSFAVAKFLATAIESVPEWPSNLRDRILDAPAKNDQIEHSYGVPERIAKLFGVKVADLLKPKKVETVSSEWGDVPF